MYEAFGFFTLLVLLFLDAKINEIKAERGYCNDNKANSFVFGLRILEAWCILAITIITYLSTKDCCLCPY